MNSHPSTSVSANPSVALRLLAYLRQRLSLTVPASLASVRAEKQLTSLPATPQIIASTGRRVLAISASGRQSAGLFGKSAELLRKGRMTVMAKDSEIGRVAAQLTRPGFAQSSSQPLRRTVIIR